MADAQVADTVNVPEANQPTSNELAKPAEAPANTIQLSDEDMKFINSNGGFEKLLPQLKQWVGNPDSRPNQQEAKVDEPAQKTTLTPAEQVQELEQSQSQPQPQQQREKGVYSMQDITMQTFFERLAERKEFAGIAEDIRSGKVLNEMKELGGNAFEPNGDLNMNRLSKFLEMYAKSKPAPTPTTPTGSDNTANFYQTPDGKITTEEQARAIFAQKGHPQHNEAVNFLRERIGLVKKQAK